MVGKRLFKDMTIMAALAAMIAGGAMTAQAAGWRQLADGRWWYATNDDGTAWYANEWQWIDGNGDGVAESYCFDRNGYMYANTTTPDGFTVNADGAWTENGVVQTKVTAVQPNGGVYVAGGGGSSDEGKDAADEGEIGTPDGLQELDGTYDLVEQCRTEDNGKTMKKVSQKAIDIQSAYMDIQILSNGDLQVTGHSAILGDSEPHVVHKFGAQQWKSTQGNLEDVYEFVDSNTIKVSTYIRHRVNGEFMGYELWQR